MKKQRLTALLTILALTAQAQPPNIIVIFTDDMGYADLSIHGQEADVRTPNIDRLAESGVLCTAGYITAPQCIPSRAGLLSGRYQQSFGLDHNGTIPLPLTETLVPQRLKAAGYATGMTGKWHLEPNHQQEVWIRENLPELAGKESFVPTDIPGEMKRAYRSDRRGFDDVFEGYINNYLTNYTLAGKDKEISQEQVAGYRLDIQHYAFGAVGQFLFSEMAGIRPLEPGFSSVLIQPDPGNGELRELAATYTSPHGPIRSSWEIIGNELKLEIEVPPGTTARVVLPSDKGVKNERNVGPGDHSFTSKFPVGLPD